MVRLQRVMDVVNETGEVVIKTGVEERRRGDGGIGG